MKGKIIKTLILIPIMFFGAWAIASVGKDVFGIILPITFLGAVFFGIFLMWRSSPSVEEERNS